MKTTTTATTTVTNSRMAKAGKPRGDSGRKTPGGAPSRLKAALRSSWKSACGWAMRNEAICLVAFAAAVGIVSSTVIGGGSGLFGGGLAKGAGDSHVIAYKDYVDDTTNAVMETVVAKYGDANALFEVTGSLLSLYTVTNPATTNLLWSMSQAHTHAASDIVSGTLDAARIPGLNASKITAGTLAIARGGTGIATSTARNRVFALSAASGSSAAAPSFRALVVADLPAADTTVTDTIGYTPGVVNLTVSDGGTLSANSTGWPNGQKVMVSMTVSGAYTVNSAIVPANFTDWPESYAVLEVVRVNTSFFATLLYEE